MSCLAFFTKFTHPTTAIVSVKCSCLTYDTYNMTLLVRDSINIKNVVPIPSLCVENLDRTMFRGRDSQGIRQVFVEFQNIQFQPSSWDSLDILRPVWLGVFGKLKKLKTIRIINHANEFLDALSNEISRDPAVAHTTVTSTSRKPNVSA